MGGDGSAQNLEYLIPAYLFLHITGGQIGLPIIILTFLCSKNVSRHPTLVNFCITWVIYSVSYCILIYSGQKHDHPSLVCKAQAAMIHGTPAMVSVAGLIVVIQVWSTFQQPEKQSAMGKWPRTTRLTLTLMLPYAVFFLFTIASAVAGAKCSKIEVSNGLYCTINVKSFVRFGVPAFCTIIQVLVVGFAVAMAIRYYRICAHISQVFPLANRKMSLSMCFRVGVFNLFSLVVLSAGVTFLSPSSSPWPIIAQATLPLAVVLVFGTQKDLFVAWRFGKRKRKPTFDVLVDNIPSSRSPRMSVIDSVYSTPSPSTRQSPSTDNIA